LASECQVIIGNHATASKKNKHKAMKTTIHPKKLFATDCLGALLTAVVTGIVLVQFESVFGMPRNSLYFLSGLACLFALYSFL